MRKLLPYQFSLNINRNVLRQARIGAIAGLLLGIHLNGFGWLPMATIHEVVSNGLSPQEIHLQLSQAEYRVGMHCPMKNHRVSYQVQAANAGGAHMALEWVMPACDLSLMAKSSPLEEGKAWFVGEFICQGNSYKKTMHVSAGDLRDATQRARTAAKGCHVETVDQVRCSTVNPFCDRQSEDFRLEAELGQHRMLR